MMREDAIRRLTHTIRDESKPREKRYEAALKCAKLLSKEKKQVNPRPKVEQEVTPDVQRILDKTRARRDKKDAK